MPRVWSREPDHANLETILELGEGGMGKAYLARAVGAGGFHRLVVIKRLNLPLLSIPDAVERFLAEARIAARIHHANVIGTQQIGRDAAGPFIVLDYIEGGSLDDLVSTRELPIRVILRIALDALYGLRAVHEARDVDGRSLAILHRDISLQNILVSALDGIARLSDFGVAKSALGSVRTEEGVFVGKLPYFPPEYLRREPVGVPLDVYALGVTLWHALTRRELWEEADDAQVMRAILDDGIPPLRKYVDVAPQIEELVMRACDRDPRLRFQSAREMADAVERLDREHDWLASHAEVGTLVEETLGPDLVYRRRRVARLVHGERGFVSTEVQVEPPTALPPVSEARRRVISPPRTLPHKTKQTSANSPAGRPPEGTHRLRSMPFVTVGVLSIAAAASLALLVTLLFPDPPTPKQTEPVEITAATASAQPTKPIVAPIESVPATPSAEVLRPSDAPPRRDERASQPDAAAAGKPVRAPSLRKQNPYRLAPSANDR